MVRGATPAKPDPAAADSAALRLLLVDQQMRFNDGTIAEYTRTIVRIQTPQGLAGMGTVALAWKPSTDTLIVHHLRIVRGATTIEIAQDAAAFTILRRENNLEYAALDGILTATIQPEGLQVGDIIDMAVTNERRDPMLKGHVDTYAGLWPVVPVARQTIDLAWGPRDAMRWRADDLPAAVVRTASGAKFAADDIQPLVLPDGAPVRFRLGRQLQLSDYASWSEAGALFAPLYAKARLLTPESPLRAQIAAIRAASPDPATQAASALALVQDRVRYVMLGMNDGNYMPAAADLTWTRRFGDCKAKTALLLALLDGLGISADPAMVDTRTGDALPSRLPGVGSFDHILVRATIGGKVYWLDGTRSGDRALAAISVPGFGWALPVRERGAALEKLVVVAPDTPDVWTRIHLDASKGITVPAAARVETTMTRDTATALHLSLANLDAATRDRGLRDYWRKEYDFIDATKVGATYDAATGTQRLTLEGTARMDWNLKGDTRAYYELDGARLGWRADFTRAAGSHADAPFAVEFPAYSRVTETIVLPSPAVGFTTSESNVDTTVAGQHYTRSVTIKDGVLTMDVATRALAPEFPAADAPAAALTLRALRKPGVYLYPPRDYRMTAADDTATLAITPITWQDFGARAEHLAGRNRLPEAAAAADTAIKLAPGQAVLYATRARIWAAQGRWVEAMADAERAIALAPKNQQFIDIKAAIVAEPAMKLLRDGKDDAALAALDQLLAVAPNNRPALASRAMLNQYRGKLVQAEADADHLLALDPANIDALRVKGALIGARDPAAGIARLDAVLARNPSHDAALVARAQLKFRIRDNDGALADAALAIRLAPKSFDAYLLRANVFKRQGDKVRAAAEADAMLAANPQDVGAYIYAVPIYAAAGDAAKARAASTQRIALRPDQDTFTESARLWLNAGDTARALSDAKRAIDLDTKHHAAYKVRADAYWQLGDRMNAAAQADALLKVDPTGAEALNEASAIYFGAGKRDESVRVLDRLIAIDPNPAYYVTRAQRRPASQRAAAFADLAISMKAAPDYEDAWKAKINLQERAGDWAGARETIRSRLRTPPDPKQDSLRILFAGTLVQTGDTAGAAREFAAVRARIATDSTLLNEICYEAASAGFALEQALADCSASVAIDALSGNLDSLGFVLLRLNRNDEAIAAYDKALGILPGMVEARYGRGIAKRRKGERAAGDADVAAALAMSPEVANDLKRIGLTD